MGDFEIIKKTMNVFDLVEAYWAMVSPTLDFNNKIIRDSNAFEMNWAMTLFIMDYVIELD